ncbi:beta-D-glucosyl crocetin beta-1,6-glucosyltransferase-like [Impatiens glandulifera]|uniref:beta-D-glucosyl crocetin beta-1,6-glucosyltransferase-like n=1 Tax=Impatiens glandulifera TaxID=253017 RepID=UPI001FB06110|nr:beta-D-glucosyl crocetin beta-1,6-glucosyltransferase-like [Impatiens glandulifera]
METKNPRLNIVMVPWLAHGHISPYLELAKRLSNRNFKIYLCSTPINLSSIKKRVTQKYSHSIKLIDLHIPSQPDLPHPNFHTTNGLPLHLHSVLKRAMDMASPSFTEIIKTLKPDILIYDFNQQWASTAAASIGIPAVQFLTNNASSLCYVLLLFKKQEVDFSYPVLNLGTHWNRQFQKLLNSSANDQSQAQSGSTGIMPTSRTCDITLMKTFGEMEGKYIDYGSKLLGKKIVPTGPLIQEHEVSEDNSEIMEWLNKKETSSTVFVSFGTEFFLSREETEELAKGLELSMVNFIWVLRFSFEEKITVEEALPNGFLERVGDRGLVVEKWAPQTRILGHPNVGGFVSHCGWGSTIEAMSFGVPILAIPMTHEQPVNARLVEEIGVGLEVNRDDNGRFSGKEIADLISELIEGEKGKKIKDKAREMRDKIISRGEEDIDGVMEELYKLYKNKIDGESKA